MNEKQCEEEGKDEEGKAELEEGERDKKGEGEESIGNKRNGRKCIMENYQYGFSIIQREVGKLPKIIPKLL